MAIVIARTLSSKIYGVRVVNGSFASFSNNRSLLLHSSSSAKGLTAAGLKAVPEGGFELETPENVHSDAIEHVRPELAISSARRRSKKIFGLRIENEKNMDRHALSQDGDQASPETSVEQQQNARRGSIFYGDSDMEEIRGLMEDGAKNNHLFRSDAVEAPLTGTLLPIRPREERWTYRHCVAADRDIRMETRLENAKINVLTSRFSSYKWMTLESFGQWLGRRRDNTINKMQLVDHKKLRIRGAELCAAQIVIELRGRVKFYGIDRWYTRKDIRLLPTRYSEDIILEAVDLSNTEVTYDGLEHLTGLKNLRWLSLQKCERIDDWSLPRLFAVHRTLEFLDLSGCPNVTDRGLGWLHHMENLKLLKIERMPKVNNAEYVAVLLEDALPLCEIEGADYSNPLYLDTPSADLPDLTALPKAENEETQWKKQSMTAVSDVVEVGNTKYAEVEAKRKLRSRLGSLYSSVDINGRERYG